MSTEIALLNSESFTDEEVKVFESQFLATMQNLSNLNKQKKKLESEEKKAKEQLKKVFDEYGIKSLDNQYIKITRVAGSADSVTIDLKKFQEEEPETYDEILADYPKTVKGKSGSIRFDVK